MEFQIYSNSSPLMNGIVLCITNATIYYNNSYGPLNISGFAAYLQEAVVVANGINTNFDKIAPFLGSPWNNGTANVNDLADTLTDYSLIYPSSYGCIKTYSITIAFKYQ